MNLPPVILASSSPRRSELLRKLVADFTVIPSEASELHNEQLTAMEISQLNAYRKARAVAKKFPDALVLGADTLVYLGTTLFGKPSDLDDARRMLKQLQGQTAPGRDGSLPDSIARASAEDFCRGHGSEIPAAGTRCHRRIPGAHQSSGQGRRVCDSGSWRQNRGKYFRFVDECGGTAVGAVAGGIGVVGGWELSLVLNAPSNHLLIPRSLLFTNCSRCANSGDIGNSDSMRATALGIVSPSRNKIL